jgi:hypothetical protein
MPRQTEPYAASTDTTTGLPSVATGQITLPGTVTLAPTLYRYRVLEARARELAQLAGQMEAAMLAAIQQEDAEAYRQLEARQGLALARAGVKLQGLRMREAEAGVTLASLQQQRAQLQVDNYQRWLSEEWLLQEHAALAAMWAAFGLHTTAALAQTGSSLLGAITFGILGGDPGAAATSLAAASSQMASIFSTYAAYERRRQEWEFQKELAQIDVRIGGQQVRLAQDHVQVVNQEHAIAVLQADHAETTADFLRTKFTNAELYDWMGNVLEGVYSFFLQQATAVARLAEHQLAFERQEVPPALIQGDYWQASGETADRRGLTGSARLLQDIHRLDQYAFETERRKQALTRTLSLARLAPAEFQRFRETGVMRFDTPMVLFDLELPGHYLRLIRRVRRPTVVALVPPNEGVRGMLANTGLSRVVVGGDLFQTTVMRREPESMSFTTAGAVAGQTEPDSQPEMLLPFEGSGVATSWELHLPRPANPFDYSTIADVLITIEYTALDSPDYRQQVIQQLGERTGGDRAFSFRRHFSDAWYDLHNPDLTATPMSVQFEIEPADFPANAEDLRITHLSLYFAMRAGSNFEHEVNLQFSPQNGRAGAPARSRPIDNLISTRRANGSSWTAIDGPPLGQWRLSLPDNLQVRAAFSEERVEDILFVITYEGQMPPWPQQSQRVAWAGV